MTRSLWRAQSIARPLAEKLDGRELPLRVLSVHARACNLLSPQGALIALVAPSVGNGPFHIVLAHPTLPLHALCPGREAFYRDGLLQLAAYAIDLREATVWEPRLPRPELPIRSAGVACLREHVARRGASPLVGVTDPASLSPRRAGDFVQTLETCSEIGTPVRESSRLPALARRRRPGLEAPGLRLQSPAGSLPQPRRGFVAVARRLSGGRVVGRVKARFPKMSPDFALAQRATWAAGELLQGLRAGDEARVARGAEALAGLGPGLTPAGDDFLVGLMAALHAWPKLLPTGWMPERAAAIIAHAAAGRTTRLSAAWLRHAAVGEFGEAWHTLIHALAEGETAAIRSAAERILHTGATSGADALAGFLAPFAA